MGREIASRRIAHRFDDFSGDIFQKLSVLEKLPQLDLQAPPFGWSACGGKAPFQNDFRHLSKGPMLYIYSEKMAAK
jgi:hypothetical protein